MTIPQQRIQKLSYYKTNKGLIVANGTMNYGSVRSTLNQSCLINGKPLALTNSSQWYFIEGETELKSYQEKTSDTRQLTKHELIDKSLFIEGKIPLSFTPQEVGEHWDDDLEETVWKNHSGLQGLYKSVYETIKGEYVKIPFEAEYKGEVQGDITNPVEAKFKILQDNWGGNKGVEVDISKIVHYSELDTILTPEFALHMKPCALTSRQTYGIVRSFVKDNIDPKQAVITSDYNFCFTVQKKVAVKPWTKLTEKKKANGRSYATPKIKTQTVQHKTVELFEMTHKGENYKGYTPIEGFKGDSLEELVNNIKDYLDDLIDHINMSVKECECCNGTGHLVDSEFEINKREE